VPVTSGGFAPTEKVYDLLERVSSIERSITYLEGHADTADKKLDSITQDITSAKATFGALKWLFTAMVIGVWGVVLTISTMWLKHTFGW
jgi:hypothetical protein